MISQNTRRIRRLTLTAQDEALSRRGALLLEDAFRIATLPNDVGGRLFIVRSLDLGTFSTSYASSSLSLRIERRLASLGSSSVHAESPGAADCPAVYFNNDAEPYICLAARIAKRMSVGAWFWPLAVPIWKREMSRAESLRRLLRGVTQTSAGASAALAMLAELKNQGAVEPLFAALGEQDGAFLSSACGLPQLRAGAIKPPVYQDDSPKPRAEWAMIVKRQAVLWGAEDSRSIWLAAMALAVDKPARLNDPRLAFHARQIVNAAFPTGAALRSNPPETEPPIAARASDPRGLRSRQESTAVTDLLSTPAGDQAADRAMDFGAAPPFGAQPIGTEPPRGVSGIYSPQPPETLQNRIPEWAHNPVWTAYAGLFFLLPMMSRLGIEDWLKRNPQLIEMEFPVRLLRVVAERMSISPDDGAWSALSLSAAGTGDEPTVANDLGGFVSPRRWHPALCRSGTLLINRFDGAPGRRILSDSSQRLALAMWRGAAPDEAREIINGASIKRGRTVRPHDALSILLDSWLTAMRRWCRRYTGMGLVEIARRPGRIVVTRTHLDLLFELRQSDARIRRAGLDLNPGWIPWLAKVVTFHYLYGDD